MLRAAGIAGFPIVTWANIGSASSAGAGAFRYVSDVGENGTVFQSNGTRWRAFNGEAGLKAVGSAVSGVGSTETVVLQALLPAGSWQTNDSVLISFSTTKSGTTDTLVAKVHAGTAGTTADTQIMGGLTFLAAAQVTGGFQLEFKLASATSVQRVGTQGAVPAYLGATSSAIATPVTITDASANALYISLGISSSGATNTVDLQSGRIQLITP